MEGGTSALIADYFGIEKKISGSDQSEELDEKNSPREGGTSTDQPTTLSIEKRYQDLISREELGEKIHQDERNGKELFKKVEISTINYCWNVRNVRIGSSGGTGEKIHQRRKGNGKAMSWKVEHQHDSRLLLDIEKRYRDLISQEELDEKNSKM
ncbi:hypothetical protein AVEN_245375-1 [Araneus ventricosus]|uniref:Uncharacterized protein n=1 Tax=Araneus ventricosus TaxID=182803 RepID=A0A4Y2VBJ0_ARAVE|nr:hypothetical protein AVEN_245375-1 [Araneus ventricosus]